MAITKEELGQFKQEYESLNSKLKELSNEELKEITGAGSNTVSPEEVLGGKIHVIPTSFNMNKELTKEELDKIAGGESCGKEGIQEFDWKDINHHNPLTPGDDTWEFSGNGNVEGQYFKIIKEGKETRNG